MPKPHLMGVRTPVDPVLCEKCGSACVSIVAAWVEGNVPSFMTSRLACAACQAYSDE